MEIKSQILDNEITIFLDNTIYSKDSIFKCLYWYGNNYHTSFSNFDSETFQVSIKPMSQTKLSESEKEELLMKFNRDIVDFNLRDIVTKETMNIRDLLVAKAFSTGEFDEQPFGDISDPVGFNPDLIK